MTLERTLLAPALLGFAAIAAGQGSSPRRSVEIVVAFAAGYSGTFTPYRSMTA
jgi:tripartite-type tricarboxylate transporter receptor subunit TctC